MNPVSVDRGFTLIEVMIALFIFAISATALSAVFQNNVTTASTLKERTFASWIAQNKLAEIHATGQFPTDNSRDDRVQFAGSEWVVRTQSTPTTAGLRKLDIRVAPADSFSGQSYSATVTTYVSNASM